MFQGRSCQEGPSIAEAKQMLGGGRSPQKLPHNFPSLGVEGRKAPYCPQTWQFNRFFNKVHRLSPTDKDFDKGLQQRTSTSFPNLWMKTSKKGGEHSWTLAHLLLTSILMAWLVRNSRVFHGKGTFLFSLGKKVTGTEDTQCSPDFGASRNWDHPLQLF